MEAMIIALAMVHVMAGSMPARLNEWATESGVNVLTNFEDTNCAWIREVHCMCDDPMHVLNLMLRGTGFTYVWVNAGFVSIVRGEGLGEEEWFDPAGPEIRYR
jgi:hypothetical protein